MANNIVTFNFNKQEAYDKWDYHYKPRLEFFLEEASIVEGWLVKDFLIRLEQTRAMAYYSPCHGVADTAFNQLACIIYLAPLAGIETPYDHVLKSDKDFEYKLNHLDGAKLKEI